MKQKKLTIKEQTLKRIKDRRTNLVFIEKKGHNKMDEGDRLRIYGTPRFNPTPKPVTYKNNSFQIFEGNESNDVSNILTDSRKKINVVISAFDAVDFIEECLDSIKAQTYQPNKILIGIDGCKKTLEKVKKIRLKYSNLKLFYSEINNGPYQMFNSLISLIPEDEYIQIFGADDKMNVDMLEKMSIFDTPAISYNDGVLFIKKDTMNIVGGFRDWRCAADSDMLFRLKLAIKSEVVHAPQYFFRREHNKQLTEKRDTNLYSKLRQQYIEILEENEKSKVPDIYIMPICSNIIKVPYNIFAAIPVNGRRELLPHTIGRLLKKCGVSKVYCMGDSNIDREVCEAAGAEWINHPNKPLGSKWNSGLQAAIESGIDYDGFLFVGSSDWVSENWIETFTQYLSECDLVGASNCYFLDINSNGNKRLIHWGGYSNYRKGEAIGIGRIYSMNIIKKLGGELFPSNLDNSMDYESMINVSSVGGKIITLVSDSAKTVSISTNKWENKHKFDGEKANPNSSEIIDVNDWLNEYFPEGLQVLQRRIDQVYVSESVESFGKELKEKYELKNFYDPTKPVFIFGMHRKEDFNFALEHKPHKIIFWCGSDAMTENLENQELTSDDIHQIKNVTHLAGSKFVSDDMTKHGIKHLFVPVTTASLDLPVYPRGNDIYFYYSDEDSKDFYGMNYLKEIKSRTKLNIIIAKNDTYTHNQLIDVYKKCFIGLRLTPHDGVPTTGCELGLMGRRIVHNGNQPNCLNYENIDDVVKLINDEYKYRHEDNTNIAKETRKFLDVGDYWLYV